MAQVRQILKHVRVEYAKGRRRCRRNRAHLIQRAEPCLIIRDDGAPFTRTYCRDCALPILKQCANDLRQFRDTLYGPPASEDPRQPERDNTNDREEETVPLSAAKRGTLR